MRKSGHVGAPESHRFLRHGFQREQYVRLKAVSIAQLCDHAMLRAMYARAVEIKF